MLNAEMIQKMGVGKEEPIPNSAKKLEIWQGGAL
jgi:hypothetical protein